MGWGMREKRTNRQSINHMPSFLLKNKSNSVLTTKRRNDNKIVKTNLNRLEVRLGFVNRTG